jgi:putative thiamine transport system ATP-binding protein
MSHELHLDNIHISKDGRELISIDQTVCAGEVLSVMGPSGAGKSTFLNYIIGTLPSDFKATGSVLLNGVNLCALPSNQREIGILFQDDLLFPHMNVGQNLAFGLSADIRGPERLERVCQALAEIGLEGFADRDPETLSGGQKARVALMRMLLSEPRVLLLDEAFSRLDTERRDQVRTLVFDTARARQLPVIMVTHDQVDADTAGGPVFYLAD